MKKIIMAMLLLALTLPVQRARAQTAEVTQLILNIEKLNQLRKILTELKKGYEILFQGYTTIRDLSKGNFKLHEAFLDGLLEVSPSVKKYQRVKDIIDCQLALLSEYQSAYKKFASGGSFSSEELSYMQDVYSRVIGQSIKNLDALTTVVTAKKLRASDDERLAAIDEIYEDMSGKLTFLRHFNTNAAVLAAQRSAERSDAEFMEKMYGIKP
jgi:DNA repair ATPase RecN